MHRVFHDRVHSKAQMTTRHTLPALVLTTFVVLTTVQALLLSPTKDELAFVGAGLSHWTSGHFESYRVNPPFVRTWSTAVPFILGYRVPLAFTGGSSRMEFTSARALTNGYREQIGTLLAIARISQIPFAVCGAIFVWLTARDLYGSRAAMIALIFFCVDPTIVAHASLATCDIPCASSFIASTWAYLNWKRNQTPKSLCIFGLLMGVACIIKFSGLFLLLFFLICDLIDLSRKLWTTSTGSTAWSLLRGRLFSWTVVFCILMAIINSAYLGEGTLRPLKNYVFASEFIRTSYGQQDKSPSGLDNPFRQSILGGLLIPVPKHYLLGLDEQKYYFEKGLTGYLFGETKRGGWWYFYLLAFIVKMPMAFVALMVFSIARRIAKKQTAIEDLVLIGVPLLLLTTLSWQSNIQCYRYLVPALPLLYVYVAGGIGGNGRWSNSLTVALLSQSVASLFLCFPNTISYASEWAGGYQNCHKWLLDSDCDWGQDAWRLRDAMKKYDGETIFSALEVYVHPATLGFAYEVPLLESTNTGKGRDDGDETKVQFVVVNANILHGIPSSMLEPNGNWHTLPKGALSHWFDHASIVEQIGGSIFVLRVQR